MTTTIQTRVDAELKTKADALFAAIGLDTTAAIRLFLTQVVIQRKIPFEAVAPEEFNEETVAAMEEARAIAKGDIYAKRYNSFSEAMEELKVAEPTAEYDK